MNERRKRELRGAALAIAACAFLFMSAAPELDRDAVLGRLQEWLDGTRDLRCRFEQRLVSGALGSGLVESGTLAVVRPGRMRWDYDAPERKVALLEGDRTTVYLPSERQLIRGRLGAQGGSIGSLLTGSVRLDEQFSAVLVATPSRGGAGAYRLQLSPRRADAGFDSVTLRLQPPGFEISAAEVIDPAGSRLEYQFRGIRRNRGVPEATFRFEPPPGVEILNTP